MVSIICSECRREFKVYPSQQNQWSRCPECRKIRRIVQVQCTICGKPLEINRFRYKNSKAKKFYCSRKCWGQQVSRDKRGENNPRFNGGTITVSCAICGREKNVVPSRVKKQKVFVCSKECLKEWCRTRRGEKAWAWKGGQVECTCAYCGKKIMKWPKDANRVKRHFCNNKCYSRWLIETGAYAGENNGRWAGGGSFEPYPPEFNERLKEAIRDRDKRKCQICGKHERDNGAKLAVHHIDFDKKNCEPDNLISLCHSCHVKTIVDPDYWKVYFQRFKPTTKKQYQLAP